MPGEVDLKQLSIDRGTPKASAFRRPRRWFARVFVPLTVLLGFIGLIAGAAGRQWLPSEPVNVVPVIVKRAAVQEAGQALFQAPGWVEPRPTAINVPALAPGVIENLLVVEGQRVEQGETIATLIAIDADLAVRSAEAQLKLRKGEYNRTVAERDAARLRVEHPVHLEVLVADAESELAAAEAELAQLPFLVRSAEAARDYAVESARGKRQAGRAVSGIVRQKAEADLRDAEVKLRQLQDRGPKLEVQTAALRRKVAALQDQRRLLIEEQRQLEEANAKIETAAALRDEAEVQLELARLQRSRVEVKAPQAGRVLSLIASPGDRVMGLDTTAEHRSSTVVRMYDPNRLQVRADVRLEDVPLVVPGQPVVVETASSTAPIEGIVLQPTSAANIQKNTLEVKVALQNAPPSVTPEMLVTATFQAPEKQNTDPNQQPELRLFVPAELVEGGGDEASVWIVSAEGTAQRRTIQVGSRTEDGLRVVTSGLQPTDRLIASNRDGLQPGTRVTVAGEDQRLGIAQR